MILLQLLSQRFVFNKKVENFLGCNTNIKSQFDEQILQQLRCICEDQFSANSPSNFDPQFHIICIVMENGSKRSLASKHAWLKMWWLLLKR
jgi:hypothetical protein